MKSILVYANTKKYLQYLPPLRFECRPLVKKLVILSERNQKILSSYLCLHLTYRNLGILICMYTGIRLGEICALTWEDISLTEGSIYIDKTIQRVQKEHNGKKTMLIIATPKTPSSIRTIPIPNQLLQIIKNSELPQKGYLLTGSTEKYIDPVRISIISKSFFRDVKSQKQISMHCAILLLPDVWNSDSISKHSAKFSVIPASISP